MPITERIVVSGGSTYDLGTDMTYSVPAGTQDGGAVYVEPMGMASGTNLKFTENGVTTADGKGGAIYNAGDIFLSGATFSGNNASQGGAVYNAGKLIIDGDITLSTGTDTVYNAGSLIWDFTGNNTAKVSNYQYVTNAVDDKGKPTGILGFWVDAEEALGTIVIASGDLSDYAANPSKYAFSISTDGESFAGLTLNNKVYFNNRLYTLAVTDEDTKLTLTVENGTAPGQRLVVEDGEWITIQEDTTYDFTDQPYYAGNGGIIEVLAGGSYTNNPTTVQQFIGGKSAGSDDPHDVGGCATYRSAGGAIYSEGYVKLVGATFANNSASGEHSGGAIYTSGKLILDSALFTGNVSEQRDAGAICIAVSDPEEGVYSAEISNTTFANNYAEDDGGAIRLQEGTMKLINVSFIGNGCTVYGGAAIGIHNGTEAVIDQATFKGNESANGGGAIINSSAELTITNSEFTGNKTNNGEGGAIKNGATLNLDNVNFGDGTDDGKNTATNGGNAIYNTGTINLKGDVKLFSNETIYLASGSVLNWAISDTDDKNGYVSDYSLIDGTTTVDTLTIDAADALKSSYTLAGNASFADNQEFTIITADGTSQTITVNGDVVTDATYGTQYTLATVQAASGYDLVLSVAKTAITITANDATKTYDGEALTETGYTITAGSLIAGDELTVTMTADSTITKVGTEENVIGEYKVMRGSEDVTGYYTVTTENGTLEVTVNDTPITLTAGSDSKMYDGTALTNYDYTWTGDLGTGDSFSDVLFSGSQTHAGFSVNEITSYKVVNGAGEDVTFCYSNIQTEDGILTVTKRDVTIASGFGDKYYDGTPLTNDTVTVSGSGFVGTEGATYEVTGSQTDFGSSYNTFTYEFNDGTLASDYDVTKKEGILTVFPDPEHIIITADSNSKPYDGSALSDGGYTVTGDLATGDTLVDVVVAGSITNAGKAANEVVSYRVVNGEGQDVTSYYTNIWTVDGTLEITPRDVTLTSGSATKQYDGEALTNSTVTVSGSGFVDGEGATYDVTGSQIAVGSSDNTFSYTLNDGTLADNYAVTTVEGTLTVVPSDRLITITADSASKMYDGFALTESGYTYTGDLAAGDYFASVTVTGSITDAGTAVNTVTGWVINNAAGEDVTAFYDNVQTADGELTITKRDVTLTSASDVKRYDGTPLTNDTITVSGSGWVKGEGALYDVTGSQTEVGSSANAFSYVLTDNTKADNYDVTTVEGTLTVYSDAIIDYNNSGKSDIVQALDNGLVYVTYDTENGYVQSAALNDVSGWTVTEFRRDLTGDRVADIQITSNDGFGSTWVAVLRNDYLQDGAITLNYQFIGAYNNLLWEYIGSADVNGDGKAEVLMEQTLAGADAFGHRNVAAWVTDEEGKWVDNEWVGSLGINEWVGYQGIWDVAGTADVDGNGTDNVILTRIDGQVGYWSAAGTNNIIEVGNAGKSVMINSGDFDGDHADDLLFTNADGDFFTWSNLGGELVDVKIGNIDDLGGEWALAGAGDYNGDGKDELLWCNGVDTAYSEANKENFSKLIQIA